MEKKGDQLVEANILVVMARTSNFKYKMPLDPSVGWIGKSRKSTDAQQLRIAQNVNKKGNVGDRRGLSPMSGASFTVLRETSYVEDLCERELKTD